jgi:hypothetical protein
LGVCLLSNENLRSQLSKSIRLYASGPRNSVFADSFDSKDFSDMTNQSAASASREFLTPLSISSTRCDDRKVSTRIQTSRRGLRGILGAVSLAAILMLIGALRAPAQGPTLAPQWIQQSPATNPPERYFEGMAYDAGHSQAVMFGGFGIGVLNDTWLWNGTAWTQANPASSPSARYAFAITYDAAHSQVVLFGGRSSANAWLGDTWLWNGTTWTQASPATSPTSRSNMTMVYDAAAANVVMFGGAGTAPPTNDTWI